MGHCSGPQKYISYITEYYIGMSGFVDHWRDYLSEIVGDMSQTFMICHDMA